MSKLTRSEIIFTDVCKRFGYHAEPIPCRPKEGVSTADFRIVAGGLSFIAEVKEICPEKEVIQQFEHVGSISLGKNARNQIRDAAKQLKAHKDEGLPMVVVLYDTTSLMSRRACPDILVESAQIDVAMYGEWVVNFSIMSDRNGGERTLTSERRTYVSGIVVISTFDNKSVKVYHNCFAKIPFPVKVFDDRYCKHFKKFGDPHGAPNNWTCVWPTANPVQLQ